jgi:argininosuccinate lyase
LIPSVKVDKELMEARAGAFWAQATDVASAIVREKGLPWRAAHQIVGILVRLSKERGIDPCHVTAQLLDEAAVEYMGKPVSLGEETLRKSLDPVEFVRARRLYGGPAPEESRRRIAECLKILGRNEKAAENIRSGLKRAAEALERAMDEILKERANH